MYWTVVIKRLTIRRTGLIYGTMRPPAQHHMDRSAKLACRPPIERGWIPCRASWLVPSGLTSAVGYSSTFRSAGTTSRRSTISTRWRTETIVIGQNCPECVTVKFTEPIGDGRGPAQHSDEAH